MRNLRSIAARCEVLLKQHDTERKEKALSEARASLAAVGLSLKDLARKSPVAKPKGPRLPCRPQLPAPDG